MNVSKIFGTKNKKITVLDNISLSFPSKGVFAIGGKSGSGKSTLLNILSLLSMPSKGKLFIFNKDSRFLSEKEKLYYRNHMYGFVHQKFNLLEKETVIDNVMLPLLIQGKSNKLAKKRALFLLNKFSIGKIKNRKVSILSGGEKQRVALIRAIVNEPEVIFADEPTGALDESNGETVMKLLKEIGKEKLVILVSHNQKLVSKYADYIATLEDGKIANEISSYNYDKSINKCKDKKRTNPMWKRKLLINHFKEDKKKNVLAFFANLLAFTFLLCTIGFAFGSNDSLNIEKEKTLLLYKGSVNKKEKFAIDNSPLSLTRISRPDKEEFLDYLSGYNISVHNDYSYFYPQEVTFEYKNLSNHASFEPIFDISLNELGKDFLNTVNENRLDESLLCYVNDCFYKEFNIAVGEVVHIPFKTNVAFEGENEVITINIDLLINGIVNEFGFLNMPRIYYSFTSFEEKLKNIYVQSNDFKKSLFSLVEDANNEDIYSSYSYVLYAHDERSKKRLFSLMDETKKIDNGIEFSSYAYSIIQSFNTLHTALSTALVPFLFLIFFAAVFICASLSFSSFLERKKEAAILLSLGASFSSIISVYVYESMLVSLFSMLLAFLFSMVVQTCLNPILENVTKIKSLISIPFSSFLNVNFLLIILSILLSLILPFIGTSLPMITFKRNTLVEELNDE